MVPLSRAIGRKRALEMLLTGEPIDAATARDWGLVNRVVPAAELDAAVAALVDAIAGSSRYGRDRQAGLLPPDRPRRAARLRPHEDRDVDEHARRRRPGGHLRVPREARPHLDRPLTPGRSTRRSGRCRGRPAGPPFAATPRGPPRARPPAPRRARAARGPRSDQPPQAVDVAAVDAVDEGHDDRLRVRVVRRRMHGRSLRRSDPGRSARPPRRRARARRRSRPTPSPPRRRRGDRGRRRLAPTISRSSDGLTANTASESSHSLAASKTCVVTVRSRRRARSCGCAPDATGGGRSRRASGRPGRRRGSCTASGGRRGTRRCRPRGCGTARGGGPPGLGLLHRVQPVVAVLPDVELGAGDRLRRRGRARARAPRPVSRPARPAMSSP